MDNVVDINTGKTVVIVEDELLVRDLAVCELEDQGYTVVEFDTADAALPYLRQHGGTACVLVTDVQMPGLLNGLQLVDIVSHIWPETPVLVTSGGSLVDPQRLPAAGPVPAQALAPGRDRRACALARYESGQFVSRAAWARRGIASIG